MAPTTRSKSKLLSPTVEVPQVNKQESKLISPDDHTKTPATKSRSIRARAKTSSAVKNNDANGSIRIAARGAHADVKNAQTTEKKKFFNYVKKRCLETTQALIHTSLSEDFIKTTGTSTSKNSLLKWLKEHINQLDRVEMDDDAFIRQVFFLQLNLHPRLLGRVNTIGKAESVCTKKKRTLKTFQSKDRKLVLVAAQKKRGQGQKKSRKMTRGAEEKQEETKAENEKEAGKKKETEVKQTKDEVKKEEEKKKETEEEQKKEHKYANPENRLEIQVIRPKLETKKQDDDKPVTKDDILLTLPSTTFFKAFSILFKDVQKLDTEQYVNDSIIEFMLHHISTNQIRPEMIDKVHVFDTFFFTSLRKEIISMVFSEGLPQKSAQKDVLVSNCSKIVQWKHNKKIDLFSKTLIVIPINDMFHWMAAAVINPGGALVEKGNEEESNKAPKCYIIFFDSLFGLDPRRRTHYASIITGYLETACLKTKTAGMKFGGEQGYTFEKDRVAVISPKNPPVQPNFTDCGLYALHFMEIMLCNSFRTFTVKDLPNFDWSKIVPEAEKMCDLMRDKIYNLMKKKAGVKGRSRLDKFEKENECGMNREAVLRYTRRHSAGTIRRMDRNPKYHRRSFTLNPSMRKLIQNEALFANPRMLNHDALYQKVRKLALPHSFPPRKLHQAFTEKDISLLAKLKESKPHKPAATIAKAFANTIGTGAQSDDVEIANKNDYTKFVTKSNAILWEDNYIQIGCKLETCRNLGRLEMCYGNKTPQPFNSFTPIITCPGALASQLQAQATPVEPVVAAGTQVQQLIDIVCVREFQKMPIMNVKFSFTDRAGALQYYEKNFYLPLFISKFFEPTNMTSEQFSDRWESLGAASQEAQKIFNAQSPMKTANIETKLKGFGANLLTDGDPNTGNYKCAGIIHTQAQKIGILIRLEPNKQAKMYHLTIRSSKDTVVQTLVDLLANQL